VPFPAGYATTLRRELKRISASQSVPIVLQFQLTSRCNLACPTCRFLQKDNTDAELNFGEIDSVLGQLSRLGTLYLVLSGGEIMCREDFWDIAWRAKKRGFLLVLCTNGSLVGSKDADRIRDLSPLMVEINLLGKSPSQHDSATRVAGSFHRAISAVKELRKRGVNVVLRTWPVSADSRGTAVCHWLLAGRDAVPLREEPESEVVNGRFPLHRQGSSRPAPVQGIGGDSLQLGTEPVPPYSSGEPMCIAGKALASISPWGEVRACEMLPLEYGNVRNLPFARIWDSLHSGLTPEAARLARPFQVCSSHGSPLFPCSTWPCGILG
jgi:MoaA/NifB/PqqE/SkfB family radical SAM enzyme